MYKAANNVPFNVRIVERGAKYGRELCLTHDDKRNLGAMVEFYDTRYPEAGHNFGQFVSRYYLRTLNKDRERIERDGLNLHGGVPDWSIDADTMRTILHDVNLMA